MSWLPAPGWYPEMGSGDDDGASVPPPDPSFARPGRLIGTGAARLTARLQKRIERVLWAPARARCRRRS
jgi:hypothetical protein